MRIRSVLALRYPMLKANGRFMISKRLALIPARGGSKRIPRKNIKSFLGSPIISYSIDAAKKAACFDEIMVSTDDTEIADLAQSHGVEVPFLRSQDNSDDYSTLADVIKEVLCAYENIGKSFEYFCCILPTAPFVTAEKIVAGWNLLQESDADSVIPVTKFSYPFQRSFRIEKNGNLQMFWPENYPKRSQDLEPAYHDTGQFYWMKSAVLKKTMRLFNDFSKPLIIPESEVQDIDTIEDWKIAEFKYQLLTHD